MVALTEDTPAVAVDELDLLVEGHLVDHEVGAGVGVEGGIHPDLRGRGGLRGDLGDCRGREGKGNAGQGQGAGDAHQGGGPLIQPIQYTVAVKLIVCLMLKNRFSLNAQEGLNWGGFSPGAALEEIGAGTETKVTFRGL